MASSSLNFSLNATIVLPIGGNIFPFGIKISWPVEQRPQTEEANFASES